MLPPTRAKGTTGEEETPSTLKYCKAFFKPKTCLANFRPEVALQFRCFQQDMLLKKLNKLIGYFHVRVEKIRDERVALQVDILLMSVRWLQLIQELDIVKDFDTSERAVLERFNAQKVETQEAKNRVSAIKCLMNVAPRLTFLHAFTARPGSASAEQSQVRLGKNGAGNTRRV